MIVREIFLYQNFRNKINSVILSILRIHSVNVKMNILFYPIKIFFSA